MVLKTLYRLARTVIVTLIVAIFVVVPAVFWIGLSLPFVQNGLRHAGEEYLTELLGTEVEIGSFEFTPLSSLALRDVRIADPLFPDADILSGGRIAAGVNLWDLMHGNITVSYAELINVDIALRRRSATDTLNLQPIIDRLRKEPGGEPTRFRLAINTVVLRGCAVSYNILDRPMSEPGRFNASHIALYDLKADLRLPVVSDTLVAVDLRRLAFQEACGFKISSLATRFDYRPESVDVKSFDLRLPSSTLTLEPLTLSIKDPVGQGARLAFDAALSSSDFRAFLPTTFGGDLDVDVKGVVSASSSHAKATLTAGLPYNGSLLLEATADIDSLRQPLAAMRFDIERLELTSPAALTSRLRAFVPVIPEAIAAEESRITLSGRLAPEGLAAKGNVGYGATEMALDMTASPSPLLRAKTDANLDLSFSDVDLRPFIKGDVPSTLGGTLNAKLRLRDGNTPESGHLEGNLEHLVWKGYSYAPIVFEAALREGGAIEGAIDIDDPCMALQADIAGNIDDTHISLDLKNFCPDRLFKAAEDGYRYGIEAEIKLIGDLRGNLDDIDGHALLKDISIVRPDGRRLDIDRVDVSAGHDSEGRILAIDSDLLTASLSGSYAVKDLWAATRRLLMSAVPGAVAEDANYGEVEARLSLSADPSEAFLDFFHIGYRPLVPITAEGSVSTSQGTLGLDLEAPYIAKKDKLIEDTRLAFSLRPGDGEGSLSKTNLDIHSLFPAKKAILDLNVKARSEDNGAQNVSVGWTTVGNDSYYGNLGLKALVNGIATPDMGLDVDIMPGRMVFNDTLWTMAPASIKYSNKRLDVSGFDISHDVQHLTLSGKASNDSTESLVLDLQGIDLDYVFGTLAIPNVAFGGEATGIFRATGLFSDNPRIATDGLRVKDISYNACTMGDAVILSAWDNSRRAVTIDADILSSEGLHTFINGAIEPFTEGIDLCFRANRAPVGFLQPFMAAFCNKLTGYVSGEACLFGDFHDMDIRGRAFADDLHMTIGFTNVTYAATDTVDLTPGVIKLDNIELTDPYGHKAMLSGVLSHRYFHEPVFDFRVAGAHDFLCYDVAPNSEHPWYGSVYGNGSAYVTGRPGIVNIGADITTAKGTDFTFVLSDALNAAEYTFITFRDKTPKAPDPETPALALLKRPFVPQDSPTAYAMAFNVDINPEARFNLVMDPVGGDRIRCRGNGHMSLSYDSPSDDLRMYGTYTLNQGSYNFTLQDIILKDFTIQPGSSIAFHGDPYAAQLDIQAYYALNANLSDLDESFLTDRDLNRTNVPVHALLDIKGDMRTPELSFDLAFPTLNSDVYRKVRSIVSTDEMMSQQIIYLLALNRFYTPEYVSATRGNELVSVASSTISSRLSSMLDALTDKLSISPAFRSDRGDFSDVEVDLALSSRLLNNRLLLNGVFGYRDHSLNNNSFIGDFDIEYLLNRPGSLRLKAYNRYNDQNYYLKSALTTQGVGLSLNFDFDRIPWFRRK